MNVCVFVVCNYNLLFGNFMCIFCSIHLNIKPKSIKNILCISMSNIQIEGLYVK